MFFIHEKKKKSLIHFVAVETLKLKLSFHKLTESSWRKAQVFHPRSHQSVELLPLGAPEQGQPLLADPLCRAARTPLGRTGASTPLPAESPCPLHALPSEQRVVRGVGRRGDGLWGGGVTMSAGPGQQRLSGFSGVLVVFHCDGYLGLWRNIHNEQYILKNVFISSVLELV